MERKERGRGGEHLFPPTSQSIIADHIDVHVGDDNLGRKTRRRRTGVSGFCLQRGRHKHLPSCTILLTASTFILMGSRMKRKRTGGFSGCWSWFIF